MKGIYEIAQQRQKDAKALNYMISKAVTEWWMQAIKNPTARLYLYYKRSAGNEYGTLAVSEEPLDGYSLAWPERISNNQTKEQLQVWIDSKIGCLPLLAVE